MNPEEKLAELGLALPEPPQPAGAYTRAVRWGELIFVAGQLPLEQGKIRYAGRVGEGLSLEEGYAAARLCALNGLSVLKAEAAGLDRVARILRLGGFVCSAASFTDQAKVVNGASELFAAVLGPRGVHARLAVGVSQLPLGAAVELEIIAALG
ncbi:MAG: RidA family protein [Candidatus Handelsmanbacteria bacterium]|nr:RidA family protein [Candidatus Handelsmanbacteria bacterium]